MTENIGKPVKTSTFSTQGYFIPTISFTANKKSVKQQQSCSPRIQRREKRQKAHELKSQYVIIRMTADQGAINNDK